MRSVWQAAAIGDLCEAVTKGTTPTSVGYQFVEGGVNFIKVESISDDGRFIRRKLAHISPECNDALRRSQLRENDILFSIAGALGRTAMVTADVLPANTNQALAILRLRTSENIIPQFVFRALASPYVLEQIENFRGGVAQQNLSLAQIKDLRIPVPPPEEQRRIVAILDKAFAAIATAKANTEKNQQNAHDLLMATLRSAFAARPADWRERPLAELAEHSLGKMLDKAKNKGTPQPYLRNLNVRWFEFDLSDVLEMRFLPEETSKYSVCKGDVVVCEGGYPGRAAIWQADSPMFFQKALHRVRFREPAYSAWFVYFLYLLSEGGLLKQYFSGTGIQHFTGEAVDRFRLPVPPMSELRKHVDRLDRIREHVGQLDRVYQQKLAALSQLKATLLQRAFSAAL